MVCLTKKLLITVNEHYSIYIAKLNVLLDSMTLATLVFEKKPYNLPNTCYISLTSRWIFR